MPATYAAAIGLHGVVPRASHLDTRRLQLGAINLQAVHAHYLPPLGSEEQRRCPAGPAEAHHQRTAGCRERRAHVGSVRKKSVKPIAANTSAMSQNRTMILVSLHPAISK